MMIGNGQQLQFGCLQRVICWFKSGSLTITTKHITSYPFRVTAILPFRSTAVLKSVCLPHAQDRAPNLTLINPGYCIVFFSLVRCKSKSKLAGSVLVILFHPIPLHAWNATTGDHDMHLNPLKPLSGRETSSETLLLRIWIPAWWRNIIQGIC